MGINEEQESRINGIIQIAAIGLTGCLASYNLGFVFIFVIVFSLIVLTTSGHLPRQTKMFSWIGAVVAFASILLTVRVIIRNSGTLLWFLDYGMIPGGTPGGFWDHFFYRLARLLGFPT
ncbi:hypothetical protein JXM67_15100 [candidate division WOR-3 bacterium]|nr:hypothetical protein [candidate division WOR-3 bacterium]